ncbi:MAG: glycosyl transferase, partial [Actinomycetes bacterium]
GIGSGLLWQRRDRFSARAVLAATLAGTTAWAAVLLSRSPDFLPGLGVAVLVAGSVAGLGLLALPRLGRVLPATVVAVGLMAGAAGPAAYAVQTAGTAHTGAIPLAGPATDAGIGFVGGPAGHPAGPYGPAPGAGGVLEGPDGAAPAPRGGTGGGTVVIRPGAPGAPYGAIGGLLDAGRVSDALATALTEDADSYPWVAATVGANNAAGYQLATGLPVMAIGGFNGTDPSPTLEQFQRYVAEGRIHWFIGSDMGLPSNGGSDAASRIAAWVQENFEVRTIDGVPMYDLTEPLD